MNKNEAVIYWTLIWLTFIAMLCFIFKNAYPLLLLFIWILPF